MPAARSRARWSELGRSERADFDARLDPDGDDQLRFGGLSDALDHGFPELIGRDLAGDADGHRRPGPERDAHPHDRDRGPEEVRILIEQVGDEASDRNGLAVATELQVEDRREQSEKEQTGARRQQDENDRAIWLCHRRPSAGRRGNERTSLAKACRTKANYRGQSFYGSVGAGKLYTAGV